MKINQINTCILTVLSHVLLCYAMLSSLTLPVQGAALLAGDCVRRARLGRVVAPMSSAVFAVQYSDRRKPVAPLFSLQS